MNTLLNLGSKAQLNLAQWDLKTFFENAGDYTQLIGGGFLALIGTIGVIYGGYLLVKKLMAGQQNQDSWVKIAALIIIGGALMATGASLIFTIAEGGQQTIEDLGGGMVLLQTFTPFL